MVNLNNPTLFFLKKVDLKIQGANAADYFTVKMKQIRVSRSDMVTFYFLFTLLPKQSNRQSGDPANLPVPARS